MAALRLGPSRSAATSSKKVGRCDASPPSPTNDMVGAQVEEGALKGGFVVGLGGRGAELARLPAVTR